MNSRSISHYWCHACTGVLSLPAGDPMICPACGEGFIEEISDAGSILPNPFEEDLMAARPNPPNNNEGLDTAVENELMELINGNDRGIEFTPFSATREDYSTDSIQQLSENDMCRPPPAPRASVDAMPRIKINSRHLDNYSDCPICLDPLEVDGEAREMPCEHIYHSHCIVTWLAQTNSCPLCRDGLPTKVPDSAQAESSDRSSNGGSWTPASSAPGGRASQISPVFFIRIGPPVVYVAVERFPPNANNNSENRYSNAVRRTPTREENEWWRNLFSYLWRFWPRRGHNANVSPSHSNSSDEAWRLPD